MISPNSRYIEQRLNEIKDRKGKNAFLESIMSDPTATVLNEVNGYKTILFHGNKGPKTNTWNQTKQMAFELNEAGFDVAFIPEIENGTCADSLIRVGKTVDWPISNTASPKRPAPWPVNWSTVSSKLKQSSSNLNTLIQVYLTRLLITWYAMKSPTETSF